MFEMMFAACALFAILVFGDVISLLTKARIPMMFVALITYMILVWLGMPKDYAVISGLGTFGALMIPPIIIHMAILISPPMLVGGISGYIDIINYEWYIM